MRAKISPKRVGSEIVGNAKVGVTFASNRSHGRGNKYAAVNSSTAFNVLIVVAVFADAG